MANKWKEGEVETALAMRQAGKSWEAIEKRIGRPAKNIMAKIRYENDGTLPYIPKPTQEPLEIVGYIVNRANEENGKCNPYILAQQVLYGDFWKNKGILMYDTKTYGEQGNINGYTKDSIWIKGHKEWDMVIRDMNRVLKARGEKQIDYNKNWLV